MSDSFLVTTLSKKPEYYERVISLIENSFNYKDSNSFEVDFAPLVDPSNFENLYILLNKEGELLAHAGLLPNFLSLAYLEYPICFLGGIAVDKKHRGKGCMNLLLEEIFNLNNSKYVFYLLWSDLTDLYNKYQFYEVGEFYELGDKNFIPSKFSDKWSKSQLLKLKEDEKSQLSEIYDNFNQNILTIKRSKRHWEKLARITSSDLYLYKDKDRLQGYFFINKGEDLTDIIHEYGFTPEYIKSVKDIEKFKVWSPQKQYKTACKRSLFSCFIKIGDIERFNSFLQTVYKNAISDVEIKDEYIHYKLNGELKSKPQDLFLKELFHPQVNTHKALEFVLHIWGLDSI